MFHDVRTSAISAYDCDRPLENGIISGHVTIHRNAQLVDAIEIFQQSPDLRILPVLDDGNRPVGVVFERDIRAILFNPFGHALLKNPSFGASLDRHVRPCPAVDRRISVNDLIERHAAEGEGCEGLIVTSAGQFEGMIPNRIILRLAARRETQAVLRRTARFESVDSASRDFNAVAVALILELKTAADQLSATAAAMAERAALNGGEAAIVVNTTRQVAANMGEVAQRSRELADTLELAGETSNKVKSATDNAVELVTKSGLQTGTLTKAADEIEGVTALIDGIARATHMLSINAAVEAARAGDAGRGFAVVASEIKLLAGQTRSAAADIALRIANIRSAISQVGRGHRSMEAAVAAVEDMSASIMDAIERQSAFTLSVARHIEEAASATDRIHGSAGKIGQNAMAAADGAGEMHELATSLSARAQDLRHHVSDFLTAVADA